MHRRGIRRGRPASPSPSPRSQTTQPLLLLMELISPPQTNEPIVPPPFSPRPSTVNTASPSTLKESPGRMRPPRHRPYHILRIYVHHPISRSSIAQPIRSAPRHLPRPQSSQPAPRRPASPSIPVRPGQAHILRLRMTFDLPVPHRGTYGTRHFTRTPSRFPPSCVPAVLPVISRSLGRDSGRARAGAPSPSSPPACRGAILTPHVRAVSSRLDSPRPANRRIDEEERGN
ncbi:hypothetical protein R3P38DRAFT_3237443 [Favolaschia claudopus]|uniref:Uncharacterized protein n=1 Tax=Favolaschia claudopus TaxID=2862362 RepID=A0AAV9ZBS2_9AGAR